MLSSLDQAVLWAACGGMAFGVVVLGLLSTRARPGQRHHFVISAAVCAVAFAAYYAMANGYGIVHLATRQEFIARYIDWSITTPLLLTGLLIVGLPTQLAKHETSRSRLGLILGTLFADIFMVLTGLSAGLSENVPVKWGFFAISCIAFTAVLAVIWGPARVAAAAQSTQLGRLYLALVSTLTILWFVYPVIWVLGPEGAHVVSSTVEIIVIAVTDLCAKVGFGFMVCGGILGLRHSRDVAQPEDHPVTV